MPTMSNGVVNHAAQAKGFLQSYRQFPCSFGAEGFWFQGIVVPVGLPFFKEDASILELEKIRGVAELYGPVNQV